MNRNRMPLVTAFMLVTLSSSVWAQTQTAANTVPTNPTAVITTPPQPAVSVADIQALRDALAAQQQQIEALKQQLQQRNEVRTVQSSVDPATAPVQQAAAISIVENSTPSLTAPTSSPTPQEPGNAASGPAPQNV